MFECISNFSSNFEMTIENLQPRSDTFGFFGQVVSLPREAVESFANFFRRLEHCDRFDKQGL